MAILLLAYGNCGIAQSNTTGHTDSLLTLLREARPDTTKVNRLFELCTGLSRNNVPGNLVELASEALSISTQKQYTRGIAIANYAFGFNYYAGREYDKAAVYMLEASAHFTASGDRVNAGRSHYLSGNIQYDNGDYTDAVKNYSRALQLWDSVQFYKLTGGCCNDMALAYARMGNYSKGVEYAYKAFKAAEKIKDKKEMAQAQHLMGAMFYEFRNYENALKNFQAASIIYKETGDDFGFARNNNMIGEILLAQGHGREAYQQFSLSLKIYEGAGAPAWGKPWGQSNIGSVFEWWGDSALAAKAYEYSSERYKDALVGYLFSLDGFEKIKDPAGAAEQTIYAGKVYFKLGDFANAKKYLVRGIQMAIDAGEKKNLASGYLYLSKLDSAAGNTASAFEQYKLYVLYKDSIFNMENSQNLSLYKTQLDIEKKDHEIELLATENKLKTTLTEKQSLQKKLAYGIIIAVVVLGVFGFYRYRRHNRINAEKKILKERLAISQDLHDHVGSTLSSISVYSKVAQVQGENGNTGEMNELLEKITDTSGKMMTEMNDIVWAINPQNDTMEKIIQRMESFARPLLAARNMQFQFTYNEDILMLNLGMERRKNFYLIFKEAVNNAIKYSGASVLEANIHYLPGRVELMVKDNGVGFNLEKEINDTRSLSGNGLRNMMARAEEMNATLRITPAQGQGTVIVLTLPMV